MLRSKEIKLRSQEIKLRSEKAKLRSKEIQLRSKEIQLRSKEIQLRRNNMLECSFFATSLRENSKRYDLIPTVWLTQSPRTALWNSTARNPLPLSNRMKKQTC